MYEKFFGFTERPFQLVPNPAYMFLSRSHEEALAHLTYAMTQGDGFVEITGEVGTGKTTLCRVFLDSLGDEVEAAYIFNPMLTAVELLRAINDEFGIPSGADGAKELIDELNDFLMQRRREGKKVLLLIDEAQNLNRDVLEQLRLLSNLETNTSKLLQIILVGQPELRDLLDSHDLRQLRQRITLSCHLAPLDFPETIAYIRHRIRIASRRDPVIFSRSAAAAVYRYSGGTPRRINIVSDRSMLTAFSRNKQKISGKIARAAVRELTPRGDTARSRIPVSGFLAPAVILFFLAAAGFLLLHPRPDFRPGGGADPAPGPEPVESRPSAAVADAVSSLPAAASSGRASVAAPPSSSVPPEAPDVDSSLGITDGPGEMPSRGHFKAGPPGDMALAAVSPAPSPADAPSLPAGDLAVFVRSASMAESRRDAMDWTIRRWGRRPVFKDGLDRLSKSRDYFLLAARQNGFSLHMIDGDFDMIHRLNLPGIVELYDEEGIRPVYLAVSDLAADHVMLTSGKRRFRTDFDTLSNHWAGAAYIPWKDFYGLAGVIPRNAPKESVITLKMMLQEIGFPRIGVDGVYDNATREAVRLIQRRHGVGVDGAVGPVTKMILYNEICSLEIPHVRGGRRQGEPM